MDKTNDYKNKTFTKEYLIEELDLPYNALEDNITENSRWSIQHEIIFQDNDGKFYKAYYSVGATECQDEAPWEYEDNITCYEVKKQKVVVEKWVEIKI